MIKKKIRIDSENRELPSYIHLGYPIGILESNFDEKTYSYVNWHWHEELQFNYITKGSFKFHIAGKQYIVKENDGIFINSQQTHMSEPLEDDASYFFIYFHPSLLAGSLDSFIYKHFVESVLENDAVDSVLFTRNQNLDTQVLDILRKMKTLAELKARYYELDIYALLIKLWKYTLTCINERKYSSINSPKSTNERLKKIFSFIKRNYGEAFNLEDIANEVNLSRSECCRFFKSSVGESLFQYIKHYRINKSIDLLINTNMSVAEIAYHVGFNSQSYFTKCFHEIKKETPLSIRQEYRALNISQ